MSKKTKQQKSSTAQGKRNRRLTYGYQRSRGRNNKGRITARHRGGGAKKLYRLVDFKRLNTGKAKILEIEKDPNRTVDIALVELENGQNSYILANQEMKVGQIVETGEKTAQTPGNRMKLKNISPGTNIYNIELKVGQGGKIARSAGNFCVLKAIEGKDALVSLPSGEIRLTSSECYATVGTLTNPEHGLKKLRKAGQKRYLGRRPKVRGVAMHPGAHPHGGGEGRSPIGMKYPKSPTGKHSKGKKTRRTKKYSRKLIISGRKKKRRK